MHGHLAPELFVAPAAESGHRATIDATEFSAWIIIIKNIIGWIFSIVAVAFTATHYMDAIVFTIKQCVYVTDNFLLGLMAPPPFYMLVTPATRCWTEI
jgi:hypothetical protein